MRNDSPSPPPSTALPAGDPAAATQAGNRTFVPEKKVMLGGIEVGSPLVKKALLFSFWDGILCNGMIALNETFTIAGAVSLKASPMAIAMLSALPALLGSVAQFFVPMWADARK